MNEYKQSTITFHRNFLNPEHVSEFLFCSICHEIFNNPLRLDCGHTFCFNCLNTLRKNSNFCPICNQNIIDSLISRDLLAFNIINDLEVFCNNENLGCPWKGKLSDIFNHLNVCNKNINYLNDNNNDNNKEINNENNNDNVNNNVNDKNDNKDNINNKINNDNNNENNEININKENNDNNNKKIQINENKNEEEKNLNLNLNNNNNENENNEKKIVSISKLNSKNKKSQLSKEKLDKLENNILTNKIKEELLTENSKQFLNTLQPLNDENNNQTKIENNIENNNNNEIKQNKENSNNLKQN